MGLDLGIGLSRYEVVSLAMKVDMVRSVRQLYYQFCDQLLTWFLSILLKLPNELFLVCSPLGAALLQHIKLPSIKV